MTHEQIKKLSDRVKMFNLVSFFIRYPSTQLLSYLGTPVSGHYPYLGTSVPGKYLYLGTSVPPLQYLVTTLTWVPQYPLTMHTSYQVLPGLALVLHRQSLVPGNQLYLVQGMNDQFITGTTRQLPMWLQDSSTYLKVKCE